MLLIYYGNKMITNGDAYKVRGLKSSGEEAFSHDNLLISFSQFPDLYSKYLEAVKQIDRLQLAVFKVQLVQTKGFEHIIDLNLESGTLKLSNLNYKLFFKSLEFISSTAKTKVDPGVINKKECAKALQIFTHALTEIYGEKKDSTIENGDNIFHLPVYKAYLNQFLSQYFFLEQKFGNQSPACQLEQEYKELFEFLKKLDHKNPTLSKEGHQRLLYFIRIILKPNEEIASLPFYPKALELVENFIHWMYTTPSLELAWKESLSTFLPEWRTVAPSDFFEDLSHAYHLLSYHPHLYGRKKSTTKDSHLQGNLPTIVWKFPIKFNGFPTFSQFIRMPGQVTVTNRCACPLPEFEKFLEILKRNNTRFLYINLLANNKTERVFTDVLHHLEKKYDNLTVITLDRNSNYYALGGSTMSSETYKNHLLNHFFDKLSESPCRFSSQTDLLDERKVLEQIINQVHVKYFEKAAEIAQELQPSFFELVLVKYVRHVLSKTFYAYFTTACMASVDRGPSFSTLLYLDSLLEKGKLDSSEILRIGAMLYTNAILVENRPIDPLRFNIFMDAAESLISH